MRTLISLLTIAASVYVLLSLVLYLLQGKMVFLSNLPGRALTASPGDIGLEYEDVYLTTLDDERLHGWYVPATISRGVIVFFHGNAGNISHRLDSIGIFHQLGLDTLIIDYRGYGQSTGKTTEQGTYLDAQAAWSYLVDERGIAADQIIIFGRSLGGAVGAWLGTQHTPAAVIIESSFSSGVDMARRLYPFLPVRLITRLRYPVAEYASHLDCPVLVVHSRDDEIIPFAMGQSIYAAVKQRKSFLELRGDHNNGIFISRQDYLRGLDGFIESVFGPGGPPPLESLSE
ncbi:MAG: alpha/beta hydrolase [Proteobacteria bacterium]|nr:alpha/beta hydrolase [Pseudomonadota bacterium]